MPQKRSALERSLHKAAAIAGCVVALTACQIRNESDSAGRESVCDAMVFEGSPFTVCTAEPGAQRITVHLSPEGKDKPYRSLRALASTLDADTRGQVAFAMNGGMYDGEGQPIGYYVEDAVRQHLLNRNEGAGNFHLLPNGIFFGDAEGRWRVYDTDRFADEVTQRPQFATQSGPMLVIRGELHPQIDPNGASYKTRNAVGVDARGRALFVISETPVSFGRLARFYRDVLKVDNALFLDGSVSQLWEPVSGRMDSGPELGPLILVRNRAEGEP